MIYCLVLSYLRYMCLIWWLNYNLYLGSALIDLLNLDSQSKNAVCTLIEFEMSKVSHFRSCCCRTSSLKLTFPIGISTQRVNLRCDCRSTFKKVLKQNHLFHGLWVILIEIGGGREEGVGMPEKFIFLTRQIECKQAMKRRKNPGKNASKGKGWTGPKAINRCYISSQPYFSKNYTFCWSDSLRMRSQLLTRPATASMNGLSTPTTRRALLGCVGDYPAI